MSDLSVSGPQLKKLIRKTRKKPLGFGFNPAPKPEGSIFTMHLKKPSKILGKAAREEGEGNKIAFGTAALEGKTLKLMVERMVPALAKNVKKFLKLNKLMLNVEIYDENGNLLESDVEDNLPEDPELDGSDEDDDDDLDGDDSDADDDDDGPDAETGDAAAAPPVAAADVARQLGALKSRIQAQPPEMIARLTPPFQQAVALLKGGKPDEAAASAGKIAAVLDRLEAAAKAAPQAQATPDAPPMPDPQTQKLMQMVEVMRGRGSAISDAAKLEIYNKALDRALALIQGAESGQAVTLLKKLQDMLKQLDAAKAAPPPGGDAPAGDAGQGFDAAVPEGEAEWNKAFAELQPQVDPALSQGLVNNIDQLGKDWRWAVANAGDGNFKAAIAKLPDIRKWLADKVAGGNTAHQQATAFANKPLANARLNWIKVRGQMESEIRRLQGAITSALSNEEEAMALVGAEVAALASRLDFIEDTLQDRLDEIVNCAPAEAARRAALTHDVKAIISTYSAELDTGFFQDVDSDNGFSPVAVAGPARAALAEISGAL